MAFHVFKGSGGRTAKPDSTATGASAQLGSVLERLDALTATLESLAGGKTPEAKDAVLDTLSRMERRDIQAVSAIDTFATALKSVSHHLVLLRHSVQASSTQHDGKLDELSARLAEIENKLEAGLLAQAPVDFSPMAAALDTITRRLSALEAKLEGLAQQTQWPFDADAFTTTLSTIADRLARVEAKLDRVSQQPTLDPDVTGDLLTAIVQRVGVIEQKVDSGVDGTSIAACLLAVDRRLSRIEAGLGMDRPLPAPEETPTAPSAPSVELPPAPPASTVTSGDAPSRERVDQLLQHVFQVLAR